MKIRGYSENEYLMFLEKQLSNFFPDMESGGNLIRNHFKSALLRTIHCVNSVKLWNLDEFDPFHSSQNTIFLYYLSNTIWKSSGNTEIPLRLFLLNKALNGIDCFYEIELPEKFFIGHSVGIVLAKAKYSNYLALYQNSTVGKNAGIAPVIETGVVMFPNTAVIGKSVARRGTIISQGVSVINQETESNKYVFQGINGKLVFKTPTHSVLSDIFREPIQLD